MAKSPVLDARLGLADYLTELRAELNKAGAQVDTDGLEFAVGEATVEVDISFTLTRSGSKAQPQFWVLGSNTAEARDVDSTASPTVQHLTVQLSPKPLTTAAETPGVAPSPSVLPPAPPLAARTTTDIKSIAGERAPDPICDTGMAGSSSTR